jgi:hypothetical protein
MAIFPGSAIPSAADDYTIDQSLRFDDGDSPKLTRTPGSAGNLKTWTISAWVKRGNLSDGVVISAGTYSEIKFSSDTLYVQVGPTNSTAYAIQTSAVYRDPSAWYHIVVHADTTQASASNRLKLYVNGEEVTAFSTDQRSSISQDVALTFTGAYEHRIGDDESSAYFDGYIAEVHLIDGTALDASSFGETNSSTNQWVPIKYTGSYGTNGFYLPFDNTPHTFASFTSTGSDTWTCPAGITSAEILVVAGGGGGGANYAGGGGAGGVVHHATYTTVPGVEYDLTVGAGGSGGDGVEYGDDGSDSSFNNNNEGSQSKMTATGGGGGAYYAPGGGPSGSNGGSGGGAGYYNAAGAVGGTGTQSDSGGGTGYGNNGGPASINTDEGGAGGGGAGGTGSAPPSNDTGGTGGAGREFSTFSSYGVSGFFAGGGGGSAVSGSGGAGGSGGGGRGSRTGGGVSGTANTGGGGGGELTSGGGGDGGSGVVLIAYQSSTFGTDDSGNGNNFDVTNLAATDKMKDSPTNNFATLNPLDNYYADSTFSEGNLKIVTALAGYAYNSSTISMSSGKWYCEFLVVADARGLEYLLGGVSAGTPTSTTDALGTSADSYAYMGQDGNKRNNNSDSSYGNIYGLGDIVGIALDLENNKLYFSKNGTWQDSGDPTSGATGTGAAFTVTSGEYRFCISDYDAHASYNNTLTINFGQDSSFAGEKTAQGNQDDNSIGDFYYDVPAGYLALCTSNLAAPDIADPTAHFNTILYAGTGTGGTDAFTGVGFQPDFLWISPRDYADNKLLFDALRTSDSSWNSNSYAAASVCSGDDFCPLVSFDSDGFTVGRSNDTNRSSTNFAAWNWKAGGIPTTDNVASAGATPTAGSVKIDGSDLGSALAGNEPAQRISANTETGFSIILYDGTASGGTTFAHGLSEAPEFILCRNLVSGSDGNSNPIVLAVPNMTTGSQKVLYLDGTAAAAVEYDAFSNTAPTASVFSVGAMNATNKSGSHAMIAYCWHSVEGYSKIGTYVGNGDNDGPFVYTGFRPAYILIRRYDSGNSWIIQDDARSPYNTVKAWLNADDATVEYTGWTGLDMNSNGFKPRDGSANTMNASGGDYLFMAFAETPFKTANAR